MAKPVWDLLHEEPYAAYQEVLAFGVFVEGMSKTKFTLGSGSSKVVFAGDFKLQSGVIQSGTITGFKVYDGDTLVLEAKGYAIDFDALGQALQSWRDFDDAEPLKLLLTANGIVMNDRGGVDFFSGSSKADILRGFGGNDHMQGFGGADKMYGGAGNDSLEGGRGNDKLFGEGGNDTLYGDENNDVLSGGKGADTLYGGAGKDKLNGGAGNDRLNGEGGSDVLTGGSGKDTFVFDGEFLAGRPVDRITDFKTGVDLIELAALSTGLPMGALAKSAFHLGSKAKDADDRIIYDKSTGALYYDADGEGGTSQVKFAVLDGNPNLSHKDFIIAA